MKCLLTAAQFAGRAQQRTRSSWGQFRGEKTCHQTIVTAGLPAAIRSSHRRGGEGEEEDEEEEGDDAAATRAPTRLA